ncbi:hypothetical protein CJF31_00005727 [Rutstroemia sp. NJR-2017a BVV2]|nr:hypothetical protein CJF31_00005727 [Rutstroemia sp. NJR-2017a BVV2]
MFATKVLRQASAAAAHHERTPMIKFLGKRSIPCMFCLLCIAIKESPLTLYTIASVDHTPHAHPASPTHELPKGFVEAQSSFSAYRQNAQQHGPLGRSARKDGSIGALPGKALGPVEPAKGEFWDRNELPPRFHRTRIDLAEIDAIETGGATLVC